MKIWHPQSVRASLTFWYAAAMVVTLTAYAASVLTFVSRTTSKALDDRLHDDVRWVREMADQNPDGSLVWFEGDDASGEEDSPWLQVWSPAGDLLLRSHAAQRIPISQGQALALEADGRIQSIAVGTGTYRILSTPTVIAGRNVVVQVAGSEARLRREIRGLLAILLFGLPLGVIAACVGGYALARRALAPVDRMAERARSITAARLGNRLPVDNPNDELGRLAAVFNDTLGTLESSFDQMRRFTADVSHELRTPLMAIRAVGEVGLRPGNEGAEAYRGVIASMLEEVDRLTSLVDRLLALSRAEHARPMLSLARVDIEQLASDVATQLGVLAEEKGQSLVVECQGHPQCTCDRVVLRQALINLVDNAIRYTPPAGHIRIRIAEEKTEVLVDVIDTGPGVRDEDRVQIFERHYRRQDPQGKSRGAGLGLSIAKWAAETSGGRLTLEAAAASGSTFRLRLPTQAGIR